MVRLEDVLPHYTLASLFGFQFQNGTIRRNIENLCICEGSLFQFQNGTIRRSGLKNDVTYQKLFQFQNGTIRRINKYGTLARCTKFQFQNGTIRSTFVYVLKGSKSYFNSKMVRLEVQSCQGLVVFLRISIPKWYD